MLRELKSQKIKRYISIWQYKKYPDYIIIWNYKNMENKFFENIKMIFVKSENSKIFYLTFFVDVIYFIVEGKRK